MALPALASQRRDNTLIKALCFWDAMSRSVFLTELHNRDCGYNPAFFCLLSETRGVKYDVIAQSLIVFFLSFGNIGKVQ